MEHIASGHMVGGSRISVNSTKNLFPSYLNFNQVETAIKEASRYESKVSSQGERVFIRGPFGKQSIEMWLNKETQIIESAWPK